MTHLGFAFLDFLQRLDSNYFFHTVFCFLCILLILYSLIQYFKSTDSNRYNYSCTNRAYCVCTVRLVQIKHEIVYKYNQYYYNATTNILTYLSDLSQTVTADRKLYYIIVFQ